MCSERWWPYRTASIKLSRWKTVACFCIKFCNLLSEWFFCISVKACCITFQGHLVIKDFVEVIEFGTPCNVVLVVSVDLHFCLPFHIDDLSL